MSNEELVFCMWDPDRNAYGWFWHEADVLLYALGQEVDEEKITAAQAREIYGEHYDVDDTYPKEIGEESESVDPDNVDFPLNEELDYLPNSSNFWREATELGIPGAVFSTDASPGSGEIFEVTSSDALLELQEALEGRYRIVVLDELAANMAGSSKQALQFIEQTRSEQLST
jgi:hypothetical protein